MFDNVVLDNLAKNNLEPSKIELLEMESMFVKPRFLDAPPKRIKLQTYKDLQKYGCYAEFCLLYNNNIIHLVPNKPCNLRVDMGNGETYICNLDPEVFAAMKTLAQRSYTQIRLLSEACKSLFLKVYSLHADSVTKDDFCKLLTKHIADDYYEEQLIKAMLDCFGYQTGEFFMLVSNELSKMQYSELYEKCINWVKENYNRVSDFYTFVKSKKLSSKTCIYPEFNKFEAIVISEINKIDHDLCVRSNVLF